MKNLPLLFGLAAGAGAGVGAYFLARQTRKKTEEAISTGGTFAARLTGYWPASATKAEQKMEGGLVDSALMARRAGYSKAQPLHTLEDFLEKIAPYVAVACDYNIFPYGQRLEIDAWPGVIFRTVDTGGHFHDAGKLYRVAGREPLDICVDTKDTHVPTLAMVKIVKGDNFEGGKDVAVAKMKGQSVVGLIGLDVFSQGS